MCPRPEDLANADLSVAGLGITRGASVRKLASAVVRGTLSFDNSKPLEETVEMLRETCGISEGTAQWIAMRSFGEPDAFPAADRKLRSRLGGGLLVSAKEAARMADQWRPWRAYAAHHLVIE